MPPNGRSDILFDQSEDHEDVTQSGERLFRPGEGAQGTDLMCVASLRSALTWHGS